jgi:hypothetical protein
MDRRYVGIDLHRRRSVIDATYGWWAVDLLTEAGSRCIWRTRRAMTGASGG